MNAAFSELGGKCRFKQQIWSHVRFFFFFSSLSRDTDEEVKHGFAFNVSGINELSAVGLLRWMVRWSSPTS